MAGRKGGRADLESALRDEVELTQNLTRVVGELMDEQYEDRLQAKAVEQDRDEQIRQRARSAANARREKAENAAARREWVETALAYVSDGARTQSPARLAQRVEARLRSQMRPEDFKYLFPLGVTRDRIRRHRGVKK